MINPHELRVLLQSAQCFPTFVNNVIVQHKRYHLSHRYASFRYFNWLINITALLLFPPTLLTLPALQHASQIIFFILSRRYHSFLLSKQLPVRTDFGIKMDIHFIFIKDRILITTFVQCFVNYRHTFIFMRRRVDAALLPYRSSWWLPATGNDFSLSMPTVWTS